MTLIAALAVIVLVRYILFVSVNKRVIKRAYQPIPLAIKLEQPTLRKRRTDTGCGI